MSVLALRQGGRSAPMPGPPRQVIHRILKASAHTLPLQVSRLPQLKGPLRGTLSQAALDLSRADLVLEEKKQRGKTHGQWRALARLGQRSLLQQLSSRPSTTSLYLKAVEKLWDFAAEMGYIVNSDDDVDKLMTDYFDRVYLDGLDASTGKQLLSAVASEFPQFGRYGARKLPRAKGSIEPIPLRLLLAMCGAASVNFQCREIALMWMTIFTCLLRPSECFTIRAKHLLAPIAHTASHTGTWTILIRPMEDRIATKVNAFDDAVKIDDRFFRELGPALCGLSSGQKAETPLFRTGAGQLREMWRLCADLLDLSRLLLKPSACGTVAPRTQGKFLDWNSPP